MRQVECEHAPLPRHAAQSNLAAQQAGQLTADGQPKTSAAVFAAGAGIRLLKRLEDNPLFLERNTNPRVGDLEGNNRSGPAQDRVVLAPSSLGYRNRKTYTALLGELECIGQQILEHLLQALGVGHKTAGQMRIGIYLEAKPPVLGLVTEGPCRSSPAGW